MTCRRRKGVLVYVSSNQEIQHMHLMMETHEYQKVLEQSRTRFIYLKFYSCCLEGEGDVRSLLYIACFNQTSKTDTWDCKLENENARGDSLW